jgi:hypothetical protein
MVFAGRVRSPSRLVPPTESTPMMDVLYFALTVGLFSLTWGLVRLCEHV